MIKSPVISELSGYYKSYFHLLKGDDLFELLSAQVFRFEEVMKRVPADRETYAYETGKWTVRELFGHMMDTERILSYRVLRGLRKDPVELAGFDENEYIKNANFNQRSVSDLLAEMKIIRQSTLLLAGSADSANFDFELRANGMPVTPRRLLYFIFVHAEHHLNILETRYLN